MIVLPRTTRNAEGFHTDKTRFVLWWQWYPRWTEFVFQTWTQHSWSAWGTFNMRIVIFGCGINLWFRTEDGRQGR